MNYNIEPTEIPAHFDFEQITRAIMGEEAWGVVFADCEIKNDASGKGYNEARFTFSEDGAYPKACIFQSTTDAIPAGYAVQWAGVMIVQGDVRNVRQVRIK